LETASSGLFSQLIVIPLFNGHKLLTQVAGHGNDTIKLLPTLTISDEDCAWIEQLFDADDAEAVVLNLVNPIRPACPTRICRACPLHGRYGGKKSAGGLWIAEDFWVLRFGLMVKRGPCVRPQASEGEAQQ
jgi:hypothetical protein